MTKSHEWQPDWVVDTFIEGQEQKTSGLTLQGFEALTNLKSLQVGAGDNCFKVSLQGLWLGSEQFDTAPFRVDMKGAATATSLTLTGGTINYGKTSFTDSVNAGYFISSLGIYLGAAADTTYIKYTIASVAFDIRATLRRTSDGAIAIDGVGNLINANLDTSAKTILSDFSFSPSDYSGAFKTGTITWNTTTGAITGGTGIVMNKNGIIGALGGVTTFSILTSGSATFSGSITASTVTASTITGGTVQTSAAGARIVLTGSNLTTYTAADNPTFVLDASSGSQVLSINTPPADTRIGLIIRLYGTGNPLYIQLDDAANINNAINIISVGSSGSAISINYDTTTATDPMIKIDYEGLGADISFTGGRPTSFLSANLGLSFASDIASYRNNLWVCRDAGTPGIWTPIEMKNFVWRTAFDSLDGMEITNYGTGTTTYSAAYGYLTMALGTNAGDGTIIHKKIALTNELVWTKARRAKFALQFSSVDYHQEWAFGIGYAQEGDITPSSNGVYFTVWNESGTAWNLYAVLMVDGSHYATDIITGGEITFVANTKYTFEIEYLPASGASAGQCYFYINGVKYSTLGLAAAYTPSTGYNDEVMWIGGKNGDTNNKNIKVSYWDFWQEV